MGDSSFHLGAKDHRWGLREELEKSPNLLHNGPLEDHGLRGGECQSETLRELRDSLLHRFLVAEKAELIDRRKQEEERVDLLQMFTL